MKATGYGNFPGGDPREFHPDPECSTERERAAHAADCAAWDAWEAGDMKSDPPAPSVKYGREVTPTEAGYVAITWAGYGLGTYEYEDWSDDDDPEPCDDPCEPNADTECQACYERRVLARMHASQPIPAREGTEPTEGSTDA